MDRVELKSQIACQGKFQITGNGQEIKEKQRIEDSLRNAEAEWRNTFDSISDFVSVHDSDFRFVKVNRAFAALLGEDADDLIGRHCYEVVHGTAGPLEECPFRKTMQLKRPVTKELEYRNLNMPLLVTTSPIFNESGEITGAVHYAKDISGIRKLISTLEAIVDHMPQGVILFDRENRVVLCNPIGRDYLKVLTGKGVGDVVDSLSERPLSGYLVSPPAFLWHSIETRDPQRKIFEIAGRRVGSPDSPEGMILVIKDVTQEREFEIKVQSQERLASIGRLTSGIAHDFNNVLTGIIGYAEIMLFDAKLSKQDRQRLDAILRNGQRAAELIRQMLDFSRKSISVMKPIEMKNYLKEFVAFIERAIPENIRIVFDADEGDHVINGDPAKLQQVLANLAVNASDAMDGGGELAIRLEHVNVTPGSVPLPNMRPGKWIALTFSDTGAGIAPGDLEHIFEPFFTTKGVGKGTGLGLSQVYGIVSQHEGYIDVKSERGKGSSFILYFPLIEMPYDEPAFEDHIDLPEGRGETILVVEDDPSVLSIMKAILEELGYTLLTAANGQEAIAMFDKYRERIQLVISDVVMPEMGSIELGKKLRTMNPSIKIIAVSGYPVGADAKEMMDAGIQEWIQKPVKVTALAETVNALLAKK